MEIEFSDSWLRNTFINQREFRRSAEELMMSTGDHNLYDDYRILKYRTTNGWQNKFMLCVHRYNDDRKVRFF